MIKTVAKNNLKPFLNQLNANCWLTPYYSTFLWLVFCWVHFSCHPQFAMVPSLGFFIWPLFHTCHLSHQLNAANVSVSLALGLRPFAQTEPYIYCDCFGRSLCEPLLPLPWGRPEQVTQPSVWGKRSSSSSSRSSSKVSEKYPRNGRGKPRFYNILEGIFMVV